MKTIKTQKLFITRVEWGRKRSNKIDDQMEILQRMIDLYNLSKNNQLGNQNVNWTKEEENQIIALTLCELNIETHNYTVCEVAVEVTK